MDRRLRTIERELQDHTGGRAHVPLAVAARELAREIGMDPGSLAGVMAALADDGLATRDAGEIARIVTFLRGWLTDEAPADPVLAERLERHLAEARAQRVRGHAAHVRSVIAGTTKIFGHDFDPLHPCAGLSLEQCVARVGGLQGWAPAHQSEVLATLASAQEEFST